MAMIRRANPSDVSAMVDMAGRLHEIVGEILPIHRAYLRAFFLFTMNHDAGLCLIAERNGEPAGMLVASVSPIATTPVRVACEHAWYVEPTISGAGLTLLRRFESWAAEVGCGAVKMSTPIGETLAGKVLALRGYTPAETVWAKRL